MLPQVQISYENMGSSSYLAVAFCDSEQLVNYQLEMLAANEILHFLPVTKRIMNGETVAYYNISSKMSLSQIVGRRKLSKQELVHLLEVVLSAADEGEKYQLPYNGLVMDPEYIYMDPCSMEPAFVYLPMNLVQEKGIRELVLFLVMEGKIELTGDNFVQLLLEAVNKQPFCLEELKKVLEQDRKTVLNSKSAGTPSLGNGMGMKPLTGGFGIDQNKISQQQPIVQKSFGEAPSAFQTQQEKKKNPIQENGGKAETNTKDGFDSQKAKKKFWLPQAVIIVILAALVSFEAFTDETGDLILNNILAAVLVIIVIEVILYREAYVNSRKKGETVKKAGKKAVQPSKSLNGPRKPVPSSGFSGTGKPVPTPSWNRPAASVFGENENSQQAAIQQPSAPISPVQVQSQNFGTLQQPLVSPAAVPSYVSMASSAGSDETELWDSSQDVLSAYLEYYENGQLTRVPLDKPSIFVGRLKGQVDFAVVNPKIGKVHAEFINQGGLFYVKDLNSKNGTYINGSGQRIGSNIPYPLSNNDRITLADSEFILRCRS